MTLARLARRVTLIFVYREKNRKLRESKGIGTLGSSRGGGAAKAKRKSESVLRCDRKGAPTPDRHGSRASDLATCQIQLPANREKPRPHGLFESGRGRWGRGGNDLPIPYPRRMVKVRPRSTGSQTPAPASSSFFPSLYNYPPTSLPRRP